jgi:hypothetical protein
MTGCMWTCHKGCQSIMDSLIPKHNLSKFHRFYRIYLLGFICPLTVELTTQITKSDGYDWLERCLLLLLGGVEQSVPSTAAIFWSIEFQYPWLVHQCSLAASETCSSDSRRWWEMSLNFANVTSHLCTQGSFTCHKISWHGDSGFTSHPKEGVLWNFIAIKNSITSAGFEPAYFGFSGKHTNHYTTKVTKRYLTNTTNM